MNLRLPLSVALIAITLAVCFPLIADAQPLPKTLEWWISFAAPAQPEEQDIPPTVTCTNGVPTRATIAKVRYFDNRAGTPARKMFVLEQQVPRVVTVTLPNGTVIQEIQLKWIVKGQTEAKSWQVKTYDVTGDLEHNAGYACVVRARGIYGDFIKFDANGVAQYSPWKVGKEGAWWSLGCGANPATKIPGNQGNDNL